MINLTKPPFNSLDLLTRRYTTFKTFADVLRVPWTPSVFIESRDARRFADAYDLAQARAGHPWRAFRYPLAPEPKNPIRIKLRRP